jgi:hypothetical protein
VILLTIDTSNVHLVKLTKLDKYGFEIFILCFNSFIRPNFDLWFSGLREDLGVEVYDGNQLMAKAHGIWPAELKSKLISLNIYEIYDRRHIQRYGKS